MSRKKGKTRGEEVVRSATAEGTEEERVGHRDAALPVVEKVHQRCPVCGSVRSRLIFSKPGVDGRMERRRCAACLSVFDVWDSAWRPRDN